jgi:RHS repeat-associated protein
MTRATLPGSGLEQRVYYLTDGNFNVTALAGTDGAVLERYAYDAYGQPRVYDPDWSPRIYGSSYANAILFCGYFRDAETGLYHVRHRYYHPGLGRWLSRDPIGYVDGMNVYEYCAGMPTCWIDLAGLYGSDVHDNLTKTKADLAGLDEPDWWGKRDNDFDSGFNSPWLIFHGPEHFRNTEDVEKDLLDVLQRGDKNKFADLMHQLQDSFSHKGYSWWTFGHIFAGHRPDEYHPDSTRDTQMRQATYKWFRRWYNRWGQ